MMKKRSFPSKIISFKSKIKMKWLLLSIVLVLGLTTAHAFGSNLQQCGSVQNTTTLEDLDCDSLLMTLKDMPFSDLLSLEEASEKFVEPVRYEIRRQFSTNIVWFDGGHWERPHTDDLYFNSISDIVNAINIYGHLIRNLKITELDLRQSLRNISINVTIKPFEAVEKLKMESLIFDFGENSLNDMFPALRHLELYEVNMANPDKFIVSLPHLEHLSFNQNEQLPTNVQMFERFISLNPQIRSLDLLDTTWDFLKFTANLSNLVELTLTGSCEANQHTDDVHFENVKIIRTYLFNDAYLGLEHITFSHKLEEIEINFSEGDSGAFTRYLDFIKRNENVKRFQTLGHRDITYDRMQQLASAKLNVTEMVLHCYNDVRSESVIDLIENSQRLNRLTLIFDVRYRSSTIASSQSDKWITRHLREAFENEWNIHQTEKNFNSDFVFLERKKNVTQENMC